MQELNEQSLKNQLKKIIQDLENQRQVEIIFGFIAIIPLAMMLPFGYLALPILNKQFLPFIQTLLFDEKKFLEEGCLNFDSTSYRDVKHRFFCLAREEYEQTGFPIAIKIFLISALIVALLGVIDLAYNAVPRFLKMLTIGLRSLLSELPQNIDREDFTININAVVAEWNRNRPDGKKAPITTAEDPQTVLTEFKNLLQL